MEGRMETGVEDPADGESGSRSPAEDLSMADTPTATPVRSGWMGWWSRPFDDTLDGMEMVLQGRIQRLFWVLLGLAVGWWVYVPLHEFLHAIGCLATGGEVWELEISALYGGGLYAAWFDWVTPHSEYAGRLSGFDTHGNDLTYLATDLAPYLLTLFPGVWLWRRAARRQRPILWGGLLPLALAPFVALIGDAYEIGSILVTRLPFWNAAPTLQAVRGDDLFLVWGQQAAAEGGSTLAVASAALVGVFWAWGWYWLAGRLADRLQAMSRTA